MINIAGAVAGLGKQIKNQKKSTAVGSVAPHSHDSSKDNAQQIPPIAPPMPDNITGNIGNNFKVQELGKNFFQGEEMANQFAQKQMDKPVPPPGDPTGDQYGNMFSPFSQKKIVKAQLIPQRPPLEPARVPQVPTKPTKKIYKEMVEKVPKQKMVKEMTGRQVEQRMHVPEQKMEKVREMPRPINMNGDPKKYNAVNVQDLQDMGAVKQDKKGQYVVNENPRSVKDTLRFPKGTKHYSGKPYKPGQLIDETDFEEIIKKVNKS
jgi:hypothetical protein